MTPKTKRIFIWLAFAFLLIAVVALAYAWLPAQTLRDVIPITPTLLIPPIGIP